MLAQDLAEGDRLTEDGHRRVVQGGQAGGESGPAGVVAIFIPPPIFGEVETVV